jgi:chromosome partitioning protein
MQLDLTPPPTSSVTAEDLLALSERSGRMLQKIRDSMLQPHPRKQAPRFPSNKVQGICEIDKTRMAYLLKKGGLPQGTQESPGRMRQFTLGETIEWAKATLKPEPRPAGVKGKVITIGNFKGGVTKTTTSMMLGQGLSLRRGRKVLLIDLDPQGSTTTLFGINPHAEIEAEQTVLPLIEGSQSNLSYAPMATYWDNLDLIPSSTDLFNAEFLLPAKVHQEDAKFKFWEVIFNGLEPLRDKYDYIIIDTAPTLSYLTINALFAADSIIVPVVPDTLSFASMVQFWGLFSDLVKEIKNFGGSNATKKFDYIDVLITRMPNKPSAAIVRDWIIKTYGDHVLPVQIPETALAMTTSTEFSTVYDMPNYDGSAEAYRRICEPYDRLIDIVDHKSCQLWSQQAKG